MIKSPRFIQLTRLLVHWVGTDLSPNVDERAGIAKVVASQSDPFTAFLLAVERCRVLFVLAATRERERERE